MSQSSVSYLWREPQAAQGFRIGHPLLDQRHQRPALIRAEAKFGQQFEIPHRHDNIFYYR